MVRSSLLVLQSVAIVPKDISFVNLVKFQHTSFSGFTLKHPWCLVPCAFFRTGIERHWGWKNPRALGMVFAIVAVLRQMLSHEVLVAFICWSALLKKKKPLTIKPCIVLCPLEFTSCLLPSISQLSPLDNYLHSWAILGLTFTESLCQSVNSMAISCFILQPCTFLDWTGTCNPRRDRCTSCQKIIQVAYLFLLISACLH